MKMSLVKAIKLIALKAVLDPGEEDYIRSIFRWYSKTYYTPLHVVPDLPLEEVLQAYYEDHYAALKEGDDTSAFIKEMVHLTETPEEKKARERAEETDAVSDEEFLKDLIKQEEAKKKKGIEQHVPKEKAPIKTNRPTKEAELPKLEMPEIAMSFIDDVALNEAVEQDALAGWDPLGDNHKKKR